MLPPEAFDAPDWSARADEAARAVTGLFGQRLLFLPGTHIAETRQPSSPLTNLARPWHYWWQAHYLDCLVDAGRRELDGGGSSAGTGTRSVAWQPARRLLTGIRLRNFFTVVNNYYDDMAWLALSALRLDQLAGDLRKPGRQRIARILQDLARQFDAGCTDDLGGGTFWSTKRDFKNTPATAPVALFYARTGRPEKAQALLDWLDSRLFEPEQGLYRDGLRITPGGEVVLESSIYSYNQGPVLGALLELGGAANLARAASVVAAVGQHLTVPASTPGDGRVLRCEGTGDGGLFTGILARYLALAAVDRRLPAEARAKAAELVQNTAEAFWAGRRTASARKPLAGNGGRTIFSSLAELPAVSSYPAGAAVELSTQLQAWMVLEAAASIPAAGALPRAASAPELPAAN